MKIEAFHNMVRRILKEEVEKRSTTDKVIYQRVPEVVHGKDYKKISPQTQDKKCKEDLLDELVRLVHEIDKTYTVAWDDHDDISINGRDLFRIRITPKWEDNYCIEAMTRNEDRIYITGQTWELVKEFVKNNLSNPPDTYQHKAADKVTKNYSIDDTSSPDKGLPQKDKPKILPLTNEPVKTGKNKDKDYSEEDVKKEDDLPEKPMKEVEEFKRQEEHKVADPVKLRRRKPDTKLMIKQS